MCKIYCSPSLEAFVCLGASLASYSYYENEQYDQQIRKYCTPARLSKMQERAHSACAIANASDEKPAKIQELFDNFNISRVNETFYDLCKDQTNAHQGMQEFCQLDRSFFDQNGSWIFAIIAVISLGYVLKDIYHRTSLQYLYQFISEELC